MLAYLIKRILASIPVMLMVALFVFSLLYLAPGDPAAIMAGDQASPADIEHIRQTLGLDDPYFVRFGRWLWQLLHGDFGVSLFTNLPVAKMIGQTLEPTVMLILVALPFSILAGVPMGVIAAARQGQWPDRLVMVLAVIGFSVPVFVLGYNLQFLFGLELRWLPVQGYVHLEDGLWACLQRLILPALALSGIYVALIARMTRATMLDVLSQDYIRTARAKGLSQPPILLIHALKASAVPIVTVIGLGFAALISGAVVTENVFAIPGIGRLTVNAIKSHDYPVIQAVTLLFSVAYVMVNLSVDLLYTLFDPRIRY
jgi:peptide/nickel transport system permease protein